MAAFVPSASGTGVYRPQRERSTPAESGDESEVEDSKEVSSEQIRQSHSANEKQRRKQLVDAFQALKANVPSCSQKKFTKIEILNHAVTYINELREHKMVLLRELERVNMENANLQAQLQALSVEKSSAAAAASTTGNGRKKSASSKGERRSSNASSSSSGSRRSHVKFFDAPELPDGWERGSTPDGRLYFVNHRTQTTTWLDPLTHTVVQPEPPAAVAQPIVRIDGEVDGDQDYGPLPSGWERRLTSEGIPYFIDHINQITTWNDPRLPPSSRGHSPAPAAQSQWEVIRTPEGQHVYHDRVNNVTTFTPPPSLRLHGDTLHSPHPAQGLRNRSGNSLSAATHHHHQQHLQQQQQQQNDRLGAHSAHVRAASFHDYHSEDGGMSPPPAGGGHQRAASFHEMTEYDPMDMKLHVDTSRAAGATTGLLQQSPTDPWNRPLAALNGDPQGGDASDAMMVDSFLDQSMMRDDSNSL